MSSCCENVYIANTAITAIVHTPFYFHSCCMGWLYSRRVRISNDSFLYCTFDILLFSCAVDLDQCELFKYKYGFIKGRSYMYNYQ